MTIWVYLVNKITLRTVNTVLTSLILLKTVKILYWVIFSVFLLEQFLINYQQFGSRYLYINQVIVGFEPHSLMYFYSRLPMMPIRVAEVSPNLGEDLCQSDWVLETPKDHHQRITTTEVVKTHPTKNVRRTDFSTDTFLQDRRLRSENPHRINLRSNSEAFRRRAVAMKCHRVQLSRTATNRRSIWSEVNPWEFRGIRWETFQKEDHSGNYNSFLEEIDRGHLVTIPWAYISELYAKVISFLHIIPFWSKLFPLVFCFIFYYKKFLSELFHPPDGPLIPKPCSKVFLSFLEN